MKTTKTLLRDAETGEWKRGWSFDDNLPLPAAAIAAAWLAPFEVDAVRVMSRSYDITYSRKDLAPEYTGELGILRRLVKAVVVYCRYR